MDNVKEVTIDKESEFRFEVEENQEFHVTLKSGSAELFGVELAIDREYRFTASKLAIFTWFGCVLETKGKCSVSYVSDENPMVSYVNIHAQLELRREQALQQNICGPRVLIAGSVDSGKTTLSRILLNYALRLGKKPTFIDLDVGQGSMSVPGTISAAALDMNSLSVEEEFILTTPLVYYLGHCNLADNPEHYKKLVNRLAKTVDDRLSNDPDVNASGFVVNTCGWVDSLGFDLLKHALVAFKIDVVIVLGHDRLYNDFKHLDICKDADVVKVAQSGGVVTNSSAVRRRNRMRRIREYFYGSTPIETASGESIVIGTALAPSTTELSFQDVHIYKVTDMSVSTGMLPVGQAEAIETLHVVPVDIVAELVHSLLAVCVLPKSSDTNDEKEDMSGLIDSSVAGFLYVKEIDMEGKKIVVLAPCPGPLPSSTLLIGSIKWME